MTYTEIVSTVAKRLKKEKSDDAKTRIGESVNWRYREIASSLSIPTIARTTVTAAITIGSRDLVVGSAAFPAEKVISLYDATVTPVRVLYESTYETLRNSVDTGNTCDEWAVKLMGARTVTLFLSGTPTSAFTYTADVLANRVALSGSDSPAYSEDFHDILVDMAMADELEYDEKPTLADRKLKQADRRMGELRMYIASSAYKDLVQGMNQRTRRMVVVS